jgi:hypothetical protein
MLCLRFELKKRACLISTTQQSQFLLRVTEQKLLDGWFRDLRGNEKIEPSLRIMLDIKQ